MGVLNIRLKQIYRCDKIEKHEQFVTMLNYKHLHYFLSVARAGGVIRAAERLHLTPQTLSGQISQFEERLGVSLFQRVGRRLELTKAGKLALSYAEEIFQTGTELEDLLKNGAEERFINFRVGIADVVPKFIAHRLLAPVLALPEPVRLICHEDRLERLLADLAIHRLDLVLADRPMPPGTEIKGYSHPLGETGVAFMAAPALAARLAGEFPDCLDGAPLLLPGRDSALHGTLPRWLERQGKRAQIVGEFDDSALMKAFGEAGAGVFPAPAASVPDVKAHYEVVNLGETDDIRERFFLISAERRLTHPAARAVSEHARSGLFALSQ
jgi:LysR family transcriptional activator of nhaA